MIKIGLLFTVCIAEVFFPQSLHQFNSSLRPNKQTQRPSRIGRVRKIEPNMLAPDLYSEKLKVRISLVDLPGADEQGSYWEATYKLYFISEAEYREVLKQILKQSAPDGGAVTWNPDPSLFPGKILLAEGEVRKSKLSFLQGMVYEREGVMFKSKIPDKDRTKYAHILSSYSVKIFDARLKIPIYKSGEYLMTPFTDDPEVKDNVIPRTTVYINFFVTSKGQLFTSQTPRESQDKNWP
ncbi:MAG: hypothetical protein MN733_32025 [Nitrososphaera sp.]|nr:hypothetical protein [Nitrososphaera sp.]